VKPLDLYLVRHGEIVGEGDYIGGGSDPDLSDLGRRQAEGVAGLLRRVPLERIHTSPLRRARAAAGMVAALCEAPGPELRVHQDLREIHFGLWEGLRFGDLDGPGRELALSWAADPRLSRPPGGEGFEDFRERVLRCFDGIEKEHSGGPVLVAAHGGTLRVYLSRVLGLTADRFWRFGLARGSLSLVRVYPRGPAVLEFLNLRLDPAGTPVVRSDRP